ncbi:MAG: ABC transporter ATP-binding protein [Deltaproteobacteria bacterium]|jgi:oligopeptide/dipeptide ABC transporter ATP-binding protein|nr:ABC transporter ATP-binding protein [Deltaproteobacteria bacterium]MCW8892497.1 ABC transporter ATP-binding protein [Deltaproteobacteria bacterium]MCW9049459.1 ABC transporter ATP-binding protein [Deltaproteobacteria bacterium]
MAFLEVKDLEVEFQVDKKPVIPLKGISFEMNEGEVLGIVGETGSGKSLTAHAIMGLSAMSGGKIRGSVKFAGQSLLDLSEKAMQSIRGSQIAFIPQNPMTSLDPVYRVGDQIMEGLLNHADLSKSKAKQQVLDIMEKLNIPKAEHVFQQYPHELSGGLKQRIVIAMGLCANPRLLIADEPTTALDVTVQAQIVRLFKEITVSKGIGLLLITHDLGVIAQICDKVAVMYAGNLVELARIESLFGSPRHPYTQALLNCIPSIGMKQGSLAAIYGNVPSATDCPDGCPFHPRCPHSFSTCESTMPTLIQIEGGAKVACHLYQENQE